MQDRLKFRRPIFTTGNLFCGFQHAEIRGAQLAITGYEGVVELNEFLTFGDWEQCTGLKDKNGNLIYENDRIYVQDHYNNLVKATIKWDDESSTFYAQRDGDLFGEGLGYYGTWHDRNTEIIGNIHVKD